MLRDDSIFPTQLPSHTDGTTMQDDHDHEIDIMEAQAQAEAARRARETDLDDVWGSDSESGAASGDGFGYARGLPGEIPNNRSDEDDGLGFSSGGMNEHGITIESQRERRSRELSEIPRLRSQHATAGYREGITVAKGQTLQEGFDEGYSLGATIGLRVGQVLGVLEGLYAARKSVQKSSDDNLGGGEVQDGQGKIEVERLQSLLEQSRQELKLENVFGDTYWGTDGVWKYEVHGENDSVAKDFNLDAQGKGEEAEITFNNVADAHPLLKKWEKIVQQEAEKARVDLTFWERVEVDRLEDDQDNGVAVTAESGTASVKKRVETLEF